MRSAALSLVACALVIGAAFYSLAARAGSDSPALAARMDLDPLRAALPSPDLYMQVPGGMLAVMASELPDATIEQVKSLRDGAFVVGFCLKSSCSYVSHLAVLQVCGNQVGGPTGADQLVLAVVRLPYGRTPGWIKSLEGRDYAANFAAHGPVVQELAADDPDAVPSLFSLTVEAKGPVAALAYQGLSAMASQRRETLALQVVRTSGATGLVDARFEVRHLCQKHLS